MKELWLSEAKEIDITLREEMLATLATLSKFCHFVSLCCFVIKGTIHCCPGEMADMALSGVKFVKIETNGVISLGKAGTHEIMGSNERKNISPPNCHFTFLKYQVNLQMLVDFHHTTENIPRVNLTSGNSLSRFCLMYLSNCENKVFESV